MQIARAPDAPQNVDKEQLRSRQEARAFLLWVLATDKEATQTVVEAITQRALRLSPHAIVIVAGVVGAPSPEEFMEALARLTPAGLQKLRDDLSEMASIINRSSKWRYPRPVPVCSSLRILQLGGVMRRGAYARCVP